VPRLSEGQTTGSARHPPNPRDEYNFIQEQTMAAQRRADALFSALAVMVGLAIGYLHVHTQMTSVESDPTLPALLVCGAAMAFGAARPRRPWRWALLIGFSIPAMQLVSLLRGISLARGQVEGAFAIGLVAGMVGALGGSMMRRMVGNVFEKTQHPTEPQAPAGKPETTDVRPS
jgi:hypothetical protein